MSHNLGYKHRTLQASRSVSNPKVKVGKQMPSIRNLEKTGHRLQENSFRTPSTLITSTVSKNLIPQGVTKYLNDHCSIAFVLNFSFVLYFLP